MTQEPTDAKPVAAPMAIRAPAFSIESPALWFTQLEAQFSIYGVVQERDKFNQVIAVLGTDICREVEDLVVNPQVLTPYTAVKNALISRFSRSREARMRQLLDKESLGSRTPSAHLRHLRSLVSGVGEDVVKAKWLSHLPDQMEAFLVQDSEEEDLDKLAIRADRLFEIFNPGRDVVAAVSNHPTESTKDQQIAELTRQVASLQASFNRLQGSRARSKSKSRSGPPAKAARPRPRSASRKRVSQKSDTCWYHRKFNDRAKFCLPGCKFFASSQQGNSNGSH